GEAPIGRYDVVTAADVFCYVGKLDEVIPGVRRVLRAGGLFAFSVEALEQKASGEGPHAEDGYRLGAMGRYAHRAEYLRDLAAKSGFQVRMLSQTRLRYENRNPVQGWLTVWSV